jgi:ferric-dicitrate binding protein FerR (iron transport regulator)
MNIFCGFRSRDLDKNNIDAELFLWFIRMEEQDLNPCEIKQLDLYLKANPNCKAYLPKLEALWQEIDQIKLQNPLRVFS